MIVTSLSACCDFIASWLGLTRDYPSSRTVSDVPLPASIVYLASRLGQLWENADHPVQAAFDEDEPPLNVFECQDTIVDPRTFAADATGTVPFIIENQGVWRFGFSLAGGNTLFVAGDWWDGAAPEGVDGWRPLEASVEDALVFALLGNLCIMSASPEDWHDDADAPSRFEPTDTLLWRHPAWGDFAGFWTNGDRSVIRYADNFLTVRKP